MTTPSRGDLPTWTPQNSFLSRPSPPPPLPAPFPPYIDDADKIEVLQVEDVQLGGDIQLENNRVTYNGNETVEDLQRLQLDGTQPCPMAPEFNNEVALEERNNGTARRWKDLANSKYIRAYAYTRLFIENKQLAEFYRRHPSISSRGQISQDLAFRRFEKHNPGVARRYLYRAITRKYKRWRYRQEPSFEDNWGRLDGCWNTREKYGRVSSGLYYSRGRDLSAKWGRSPETINSSDVE